MRGLNTVFAVTNWGTFNITVLPDLLVNDVISAIVQVTMQRIAGRETTKGCLPGAAGIPCTSKPQ